LGALALSELKGSAVDLTIFVPCYNEAQAIGRVLAELVDCLGSTGMSYEVIVIDDGSTDDSVAVATDFGRLHPTVDLHVVTNETNRGISHNYTNASFLGRGEFFCRVSGHFQDRRDAILPLIKHLGEADVIIGYLTEDGRSRFRRLLSRLFTRLVNTLSGYDIRYYLGVVIFRRSLVLRWHSYRHQAFQADMITRILDEGHSYLQIPIRAHQRPSGRSRAISIKNLLSVTFCLADILGRRVLRRPRKI
jgi:glycosyltransferase involved in cell wall biosynthesis